ncbi:MAG: lamin tail domain-containing protein [Anaerolineae bacterium]|nr:lamin tail domain-containing protein [Anaerolineae bacterium]
MARRSLLGFLFLNIVVTILVTSAVILISDARRPNEPTPARGLLQVVVTATTDPDATLPVVYVVVTATPPGTRAAASILPTPTGGAGTVASAGLDTTLLPQGVGTIEAPTFTPTDPSGCPTHSLVEGEFLGAIATRYGVTVDQIREANELTPDDDTRLQIGDVLIIPVEGCGLATRTPTPTPSPTVRITDTPLPTSTPLAALASGAQLEIVDVVSAGDITEEQIVIRNNSDAVVEIGGWTLSDANGNTYTFPDYQMFGGRSVLLYTREGENTPRALYWGLERAIWGDARQTITLRDRDGEMVLSIPISAVGANVPTPTPAR